MSEICSLEDLLNVKLIPNVGKVRNSLSPQLRKIYDLGFSADLSELADCYNALPDIVASEPKALILSFYLLKILELPELPENFHTPILFFIKTLVEKKFIETKHIFNRVVSKSIYTVTEKNVDFKQIISEIKFMKTILEDYDYDTTAEIGFLTALVKGKILDSVNDYKSILKSLKYLKKGLRYGLLLETTKKLLARMIIEWAKDNKNSKELKRVIKEMKNFNFDKELMNEIKKQDEGEIEVMVEDRPEIPGPDPVTKQGPKSNELIKINPIYMSNPGLPVQVIVYECTKNGITEKIALKECKSTNITLLDQYVKEAIYLEKLSGKTENFLKFYDKNMVEVIENGIKYYVFKMEMEYVEENLVADRQRRFQYKKPYSESEFTNIFNQLIKSFLYMHSNNINHRDIKPSNILITKEGVIKIIDFSVSCEYNDQTQASDRFCGTIDYMSPEMRKGLENSSIEVQINQDKSDVFSLGMTLLYLLIDDDLRNLNLESNKKLLEGKINKVEFGWLKVILHRMLDFNVSNRCRLMNILCFSPGDETISN